MDLNDIRAWHTAILMFSFIGIVIWAYSKRRKSSFDEAANLPFADQDQHEATIKKENLS
ncbi:MAG: cbb3-type cytochrome c oxidase subunit 3 [Desulfobacterales bacterium]|nr:cbb3-type cytochrome c oxidase subunit 3 [Desulfobacterales bacterium]